MAPSGGLKVGPRPSLAHWTRRLWYSVVVDAVRLLSVKVFAQRAFDAYRGDEVLPGSHVQSDADIDAFVRATAETAYHPSCTCRMGSPDKDDMVVVDPLCRVVGVDRLRVVDASIMPSIVSGNLNGPVIMLAEKAADLILGSVPSASQSSSSI